MKAVARRQARRFDAAAGRRAMALLSQLKFLTMWISSRVDCDR
jgi:hypothetical protein